MSKRSSDGDVLTNRVNMALANSQRRLAAMLGPQDESHATTTASRQDDEDEDLRKEYADPEQLGVGGMRPKDVADGSFTKRTITSSDKLLEQLIGKKKAKAHLAAKQNATRLCAKPQAQGHDRSHAMKDESEDEDEGRTAAFKSKKRRTEKTKPVIVKEVERDGDEDVQAQTIEHQNNVDSIPHDETEQTKKVAENTDVFATAAAPKPIPSRGKPKATSFLDEILAEQSKKKKNKKNKSQNKATVEA
ncbi:hypothetical protein EK21DRAFT_92593 [Setomelanomma holmii]|uniref:Uncharacterized protein n=1 Tax=Setomelanomma holmii TaxID=210430 RepID=A0A9P4LI58_9PLEO|nr:hypothetical protein EK21DRAFT_92593 [Setomelanomma holmii]